MGTFYWLGVILVCGAIAVHDLVTAVFLLGIFCLLAGLLMWVVNL